MDGRLTPRRRRLERRALPLATLALLALGFGMVKGATHTPPERRVVERFATAWERGDHVAMSREVAPGAPDLARAYADAAAISTARSFDTGEPAQDGEGWVLPVTARTGVFGDVRGEVRLALEGDGEEAKVRWAPHLVFPGMPEGSELERTTTLPERAAILARDNLPLAEGPDRTTTDHVDIAESIVGELGPVPEDMRAEYRAAGYPDDARVGISGLERIFERRLAGTPGGRLTAGGAVLAERAPQAGRAVRTTLAPSVQRAAIGALGGRLGGVVAMVPETGEILAAAGIAFSGLQPPGSTFKMITLAGALQKGVASPSTDYPVQTEAILEGVGLSNANGESCGGTLTRSFAHSCNSVFAPLGAELGAEGLVAVTERFGFNREAPIPGAATSTIPPASDLVGDLVVGSSAIGQGQVQATTLQMTMVAAAFALDGRLPRPTLAYSGDTAPSLGPAATTPRVARQVKRMMVEVVRDGTGGAAAIPGVTVAGKTGTAELRSTEPCDVTDENIEACDAADPTDTTDTTAWFTALAPAEDPEIAVGVMLVASGAGGDSAAPAARLVLQAALER